MERIRDWVKNPAAFYIFVACTSGNLREEKDILWETGGT